jgi:hypothetical protein
MTEEGTADPNIDVDISGDGDVGRNNDDVDDANDDDVDAEISGDGSGSVGSDIESDDDYFCYEHHFEYDPYRMDMCTREYEYSLSSDGGTPHRYVTTTPKLVYLNEENLRLVSENDPGVTDLILRRKDWIEGAGRVIGESRILRDLEINYDRICDHNGNPLNIDEPWMEELCRGLSINRSIELFRLRMNWNESQMDIFRTIAPLFENNDNLRYLEIYRAEPRTLESLSVVLSGCKNSHLEHICLTKAAVPEAGVAMFIKSLNSIHSLLDLRFEQIYLGKTGTEALADLLNNPTSKLQELLMNDTRLGKGKSEDGVYCLRKALAINKNLRTLSFFFGDGNTSLRVWQGIVECLANPNGKMEELTLKSSSIADSGMICLGDALVENQTLKILDMVGFKADSITSDGWQSLSTCLTNPKSALEELSIRYCNIDQEGIETIIEALDGNTRLKKLTISSIHDIDVDGEMWEEIWERLDAILGDTTIEGTFSSNHTLEDIKITSEYEDILPAEYIRRSLNVNKNENKSEVARQKILKCYFPGDYRNIHIFTRIPESVLVYAMEWMGRNNLGYSLMYSVVRCFPHMFDARSGPQLDEAGRKRKR